jgi:hypothetical protein
MMMKAKLQNTYYFIWTWLTRSLSLHSMIHTIHNFTMSLTRTFLRREALLAQGPPSSSLSGE